MKLLNKCDICYFHYLKIILNNDSFKEFVNPVILINLKYVYAIIKKVYCFNWLPWTFTGSSHFEVFFKTNLIQKTLKFYTSWLHWKSQCRSSVGNHALLWNKHEYQDSAGIFVKNIFNPFPGTGLFQYFLKYIRKPEVSWCFQGTLKESSAIKWVKSHFILSYLLCYIFK